MHILETLTQMLRDLTAAEAPQRQLNGVQEWRVEVTAAVAAGTVCGSTTGMNIHVTQSPHDTITHRAWRNTCQAIIRALQAQQAQATKLQSAEKSSAEKAETKKARNAALARAESAAAWKSVAARAETTGVALISREDAIVRPVAAVIAAAGGINEVARDKHYHQHGRRGR